jgi:hypothetical protein
MNLPRSHARGVLAVLALIVPLGLAATLTQEQTAQAQQGSSTAPSNPLPDGIYLFGDTPEPDQIRHNYVVFEVNQGQAIGAFYAPYSEFACFTGEQQGSQLDVSAISFNELQEIEATAQLDELHPIDSYSANDQRILSICKREIGDAIS